VVIAIYLVILVAAFYFLIVRPQRRQSMVRRQLLNAVEVGDEIVTSGGVYGTVLAIDDESLDVEIAPGVVVKVARGAVAARLSPESADDGDEDTDAALGGDVDDTVDDDVDDGLDDGLDDPDEQDGDTRP
jgi:preprotein translocase subunit YajC